MKTVQVQVHTTLTDAEGGDKPAGSRTEALVHRGWYKDVGAEQWYKLLRVSDETVEHVDLWGTRRETNRMMWERNMRPTLRIPVVL